MTRGVKVLLKASANAENSVDPLTFWRDTAKSERATVHDICWDAQNICSNQGSNEGTYNDPAWRRGYTIGHYNDAESLAQIYFTYADSAEPCDPYDVVHVGAAFWVRSGGPRTWIPYTTRTMPKIEAAQRPLIQRPFARVWYRFHGRHLQHIRSSKKHPEWYD